MQKEIKKIGFWILLFLTILFVITRYDLLSTSKMSYSDLYNMITAGEVTELSITENTATVITKDNEKTEIALPHSNWVLADLGDEIRRQVEAGTLKYDTPKPPSAPWWITILPTIGFIAIMVMFWFFFMQQSGGKGGGGGIFSFGKMKSRLVSEDKKKVFFKDVAGADEEKAELEEIVDFLKTPQKFTSLGARIPRGVLLVGPPGTGKTLLAKAVAGEAGVPFFSISGSDFVEMFVGVGASRVRDLFDQAKKAEPAIVFIDEIDAVGRHRGAGMGGGHDEREQTLNQLLVEMDGFGLNQGVIIIAATNRPDILDPALLRPGRFDRQVTVGSPDIKGREQILEVHTKGKPLAEDVSLETLAKTTSGFTGADLENLTNEAALLSARRDLKSIGMKELEESIIKVIAGPEKKTRVVTEKERRLTAYHEAGHAIVTHLLPLQDPVHQVSIIPRGRAGGFTLSLPKEDKYYASKNEMVEEIVSLLGGRVAEQLVLDDISTGASNDIMRATGIAKKMVTKYGMSEELGAIAFGSENDEVFLGRDYGHARDYSEDVAAKIDAEVKRIIDGCYATCTSMLNEHMEKLHVIARELLDKEKIDADEFLTIVEK